MNLSKQSRREMMLNSVRAIAGLALAGGCQPLSLGERKGKGCYNGFKIGICDWSLGRMTELSAMEVARRLRADGVQVDFGSFDDGLPLLHKAELQKQYLESAKKHNIEIASFGMVALGWVPYKSDPRWEQWIADGIDVSKKMGVGIILIPFFGKGDLAVDAEGRPIVVKKLKDLAPKAERNGVTLALESWMSAEQNLEIIEHVDSDAVKVYYDVGNSHKRGYDIYKEIRILGKHICQFHAKDYGAETFGKGDIDFKAVREAMDDIGYRGWIVFESTKWEPDTLVTMEEEATFRKNIEYLRSIFPPKL
jgi:L-ribulose-5-phosphate 3-epimerase